MTAGDLLMLYTDGITEATNPEDEEFGVERLRQFAGKNLKGGLEEIDTELFRELDRFAKDTPFGDDRTIVLVRRTG